MRTLAAEIILRGVQTLRDTDFTAMSEAFLEKQIGDDFCGLAARFMFY